MVFSAVLASIFLSGSAAGSVPVYRTVVSISFDDGRASQLTAAALLASRGMHATFYLNSGTIGDPNRLAWDQVDALAAAGNEIGGHTVNHVNVTTITLEQARTEICDDRSALITQGFAASSFAYPYGESNSDVEALAADCGYESARLTQGIGTVGWCETTTCPAAETIPPWAPYAVRATGSVTSTTTLAELESLVTSAEQNGGGWVPLVFHDVGNDTDGYSISESEFTAFLDWLSLRGSKGTIVRTVGEVMSGAVDPPPPGPNLLQNPSFENDTNEDGQPDCWATSSWGTNSGSWIETSDAHSTGVAVKGEITSWTSDGGGEQKFMVDRSSECAPAVTPGHTYRLTGWYKGTLSPYLTVYWDDGLGSFSLGSAYSPDFPASSDWHAFSWTTQPAPAGATALSIAITIGGATGDITIDDLALGDAAGTPPSLHITAPATGGYVSGSTVTLSANASDDEGVQNVEFFVDDQPIDTVTISPYSVSWDSTTASEGTHTLTVLATDVDGAQSYDSLSFTLDTGAPQTTIDSGPSGPTSDSTPTFAFSSSETGSTFACKVDSGSFAPCSSPHTTAALTDGAHTFEVKASDQAGNTDASPASRSFTLDTGAPTGSLVAPASDSFLRATVALQSDSSDSGGSGVESVSFQRSPAGRNTWTTINADTSSPYTANWDTSAVADGSYALRVVTADAAGNKHSSASVSVTVDNTPPAGSLTRPGTNVFVRREVVASSDSADPTSGVAWVAYEIAPSGYGPWQTAAAVTSAPWSARLRFPKVAQGRYYVRAVTTDLAGNTFVSQARRVGLDNTAPTSSIACNSKQGCRAVYSRRVQVAIRAYDRGSGVRAIRYTTNGRIPTASSSLYRRPLTLAKSCVFRWRVWDRAGNVSRTWSRAIRVSATRPSR
jgi:hypothetical protein